METVRSADEIDDVLNRCADQENAGGSAWPGMTYEQGVSNALRWAVGHTDDNPMED